MLSLDRSDARAASSSLLIRPAVGDAVAGDGSGEDDEAFVVQLASRAFRFYGTYDAFVRDWLHDSRVTTWIAEDSGARAGFFMVTIYPDPERETVQVADLVAIAVEPDRQSGGIGQKLLTAALSVSEQRGAVEMWLVVAEGNARAQRFFARNGFRLGPGVGVYPGGQTARRMLRPLRVDPTTPRPSGIGKSSKEVG